MGRLGGDEFAVVAEEIGSPEDAMRLARRICTALGKIYHVNGHDVTTSASVGIAIGPLTITAEGVETENQAEILRKWGCNQVQGFYYGRPDPEVPESEGAIASQPRVA